MSIYAAYYDLKLYGMCGMKWKCLSFSNMEIKRVECNPEERYETETHIVCKRKTLNNIFFLPFPLRTSKNGMNHNSWARLSQSIKMINHHAIISLLFSYRTDMNYAFSSSFINMFMLSLYDIFFLLFLHSLSFLVKSSVIRENTR